MTLKLRFIASLAIATTTSATLATAQESNHLCFIRRASGQVVDLTPLCLRNPGFIPNVGRSTPATNPSPLSPRETSSSGEANLTKVGDGKGGYVERGVAFDYAYELWTNAKNSQYILKVWQLKGSQRMQQLESRSFNSSRQALDYFDCRYSKKREVCNLP